MTTALTGVIRDGRVELDTPAPLPNGTRVRVEPTSHRDGFIPEDEWPTTPEGIEEFVRHMKNFEPLVFTDEELRDFEANRKRMGRYSMAKLDRRV